MYYNSVLASQQTKETRMEKRTAHAIAQDITNAGTLREAARKAGDWAQVDRLQLDLDALADEWHAVVNGAAAAVHYVAGGK